MRWKCLIEGMVISTFSFFHKEHYCAKHKIMWSGHKDMGCIRIVEDAEAAGDVLELRCNNFEKVSISFPDCIDTKLIGTTFPFLYLQLKNVLFSFLSEQHCSAKLRFFILENSYHDTLVWKLTFETQLERYVHFAQQINRSLRLKCQNIISANVCA